ncbi:EFP [Parapoynx stagnalis nucleopolyhedrovirus]|uniref:EFP n=1 Tax=Parapoynx stagnalis nucleopolyhedrovirus TaxID=2993413 RepID=A0A9E7YAS2_9ABAC|nr:EFP [Parapoynx stagnalis nucleopolyhedrovirus]
MSKKWCLIVILLGVGVSAAAPSSKFQYASVDDSTGLLFEHLYNMRHVTTDRFVFIQQIDYFNMLQELQSLHSNIVDHKADISECGHLIYQQYLDVITHKIDTFNNYLSVLQTLDTTYVRYTLDDKVIDMNVLDYKSDELIETERSTLSNPEWSKLNAKTAKLLLSSRSDLVKRYSYKNTSSLHTLMKPIKTACDYIDNLILMFSLVFKNVTEKLSDLQALLVSLRYNKLKSNIFSEDFLLQEMKRQRGILKKHGRAWVTDHKTAIKNKHFKLAEAYRLYVYVKKYTVTLYIVMPLLNETSTTFNIYKVMTVPFCRGKSCLFMIPNNEYIAVSESKNYYVSFKDDYKKTCSVFTGYDEYLCPEIETVPTINSNICEIEMYMGRYSNVMTLCDLRLGSILSDTQYTIPLVDHEKWLYMFVKKLNISYFCNRFGVINGMITVPSGVGIFSAKEGDVCSIRLDVKTSLSSNTTYYNIESTTYWPKKKFNYNNYFDQYMLGNASANTLKRLNSFDRAALLTLKSKFDVNNFQTVPTYFVPANLNVAVNEADITSIYDQVETDNSKIIYLTVGILSAVILIGACILWYWCCCIRKKSRRITDNVTVKYNPKKIQNDETHLMKQHHLHLDDDDLERGDLMYITVKKDVPKTNFEKEITAYPLKSRVIK